MGSATASRGHIALRTVDEEGCIASTSTGNDQVTLRRTLLYARGCLCALGWSNLVLAQRSAIGSLPPRAGPLPIDVALSAPVLCGEGLGHLSVSPDGERVAYAVTTPHARRMSSAQTGTKFFFNYGCQVRVTDLGTARTVIVPSPAGSTTYDPVWAPDGRQLAMVSDRGGTAALWVWDRVTQDLRPLTSAIVRGRPTWTPDSRRLVVITLPDTLTPQRLALLGGGAEASSLGTEPGQDTVVWVYANAPHTGAISHTESIGGAAWTHALNVAEITTIDVGTGVSHRVAAAQPVTSVALSPDGTRLAWVTPKRFDGPGSQHQIGDVLLADLRVQGPRVLLADVPVGFEPAVTWSPDGSRLAYCTGNGASHVGDCALLAIDSTSGLIVRATIAGANELAWSADGAQAYAVAHDTLWTVASKDGAVAHVTAAPAGVD